MQCSVCRGSWKCRRSCNFLYVGGHEDVGCRVMQCSVCRRSWRYRGSCCVLYVGTRTCGC